MGKYMKNVDKPTLLAEKFGRYISNIVHAVHCRENGPQYQFTSGDAIKLARDRIETNKWISLICVLVILLGSVGMCVSRRY